MKNHDGMADGQTLALSVLYSGLTVRRTDTGLETWLGQSGAVAVQTFKEHRQQ